MLYSEEKEVLRVQMFGGFSVLYNGKEVALGRNSSAKFIQLLQMVWLQGDKGISKEQLVSDLYDRNEITNINSSFNTLIYRMRQQMRQVGLPNVDYVIRRKGLYVPDDKIQIWVDVQEFEQLYEYGLNASNDRQKYHYFQQVFDLYQGELLPDMSNEIWVFDKSETYKKIFVNCVRWLGEYTRRIRDYKTMEIVYAKAARIYPLEEWEVGQMKAIMEKGEFKRALELYYKTIERYSEELGLPPSQQMLECYNRMSRGLVNTPGLLAEIQASLRESVESNPEAEGIDPKYYEPYGAYYCSYPSFVDVYRLFCRNRKRMGMSMYLMLCTLVDYEGKAMYNMDKLKIRSGVLNEAIRQCLRQGDTFTKYSASQYLLLLMNVKQEDCEPIFQRLNRKLREMTSYVAGLQYQAAPIEDMIFRN